MKIFIIDFSADSLIEVRISQDIEIYRENKDGGYKMNAQSKKNNK